MNNIDFVKKCIPFADGFELNDDQLIFPEGGIETLDDELLNLKVWKLVWEPLLLQKAIEGFNKRGEENNNSDWMCIEQDCISISLESESDKGSDDFYLFYKHFNSIGEVKHKALEYVFERIADE